MKELAQLLKNIKKKELRPVYFFHGEEPYFTDVAIKSLENDVLEEDEKAFGQTVIYGKDSNMAEILSLAQQFPMFGNYNLIIVKEAQDLRLDEDERRIFETYLQNPVATTVLAFGYKRKKLAATTKLYKALQKNGWIFYSEPVRDYNLAKWIAEELQNNQIKTAPNISHLLAEYLGNDLSRIANEIAKLKMILKDGEVLDEKLVETHIGISKDFNIYELQKALGSKNHGKAIRIAHYIGKNPKSNPYVLMIGSLYNYFSNLIIYHTLSGSSQQEIASTMGVNPYFVREYAEAARRYTLKNCTRIISLIRESDLKNKGLGANNTDDSELLLELVYKILNVDQVKVQL